MNILIIGLIVLAAWFAISVPVALIVGKAISLRDEQVPADAPWLGVAAGHER